MPEGFEPPVPAWAADWSNGVEQLTTAFFGVQGDDQGALEAWVAAHLRGAPHVERLEYASYVDLEGINNSSYIAYFQGDGYRSWWESVGAEWWISEAPLAAPAGYWREVFHVPVARLETLHSTPNAHGVASLSSELEGPVEEHAYPGAARDRIPASGEESLRGLERLTAALSSSASDDGRRVRVQAPPNLCVIRSGQDWTHCVPEERAFYLEEVEPHLVAGMDYLANNPDESRCLSMRLMRNHAESGDPLEQTFGLGYALDIYAFEEWAKSHPTHLRIFGSFMQHAERFGEALDLRLWHEVSVLADNASEFEYVDCHRRTGLLAHA